MKSEGWQTKLKQMIPSYGQHLMDNKALATKTRAWAHQHLGLTD
jgi:malate dehydrogenase (quinone)